LSSLTVSVDNNDNNNSSNGSSSNNGSSQNRSAGGGEGGWGKLTVAILAGMLLVSTLIVGITLPLSSSLSPSSSPSEERETMMAAETSSVAATAAANAERDAEKSADDDDFELYGHTSSAADEAAVKELTLVAQEAELEIAPGKVVKTWTFNGTVPGPALRFVEGDHVRIKFINKTPIPHTLHLHGNHDDTNDGVLPQIMPNDSYIYNITAGPAGALMYHCHAHPTSLHIRMGMYGAMIIDPKDKPMEPAREFVMVMGEYDSKDIMKFEAEYYPINGYADQYMKYPLEAMSGELVRMYVINIGTTIPYQFHLHSTIFKAYPSGLLSNEPIDAQTIAVGPGDATIVEARWKYPGEYLFHSHGIQEERGNMGQIHVVDSNQANNSNNGSTLANNNSSTALTNATTTTISAGKSVSMFDWQYELQNKLQKPKVFNYTDDELMGKSVAQNNNHGAVTHDEAAGAASHNNTHSDEGTAVATTETRTTAATTNNSTANPTTTVSIASGASNPNSGLSYEPLEVTVKSGSTIIWTNKDSIMHTATSGSPEAGPSGIFDTGIIGGSGEVAETAINAMPGIYDYYCTLHPHMKGRLTVTE
jgi:nitrite reductase (NO-forming)